MTLLYSSRIRSALPTEWASSSNGANKLDVPHPPRLCHTLSAPIVKPLDWGGHLTSQKSNSDPSVPTRRTLGTDFGSRLAREVLNASSAAACSSPNGMDIDPSSPRIPNPQRNSRPSLACSPGLGDLFEEQHGGDCSSPEAGLAAAAKSRKRGAMDDPDFSLNEINTGSPAPLCSNPLAVKTRPRALHRATSAAVLGSSSSSSGSLGRRRASGQLGSGTWAPGSLAKKFAAAAADETDDVDNSGTRHRKVSRGADGRPNIHRGGSSRRAQSMCDSEFYASPPLGGPVEETGNGSGYFGMSHPSHSATSANAAAAEEEEETEELHEGSGYLAPPQDLLSPPRPVLAPSKLKTYQPSPEANMKAGFGETEMKGKILPCFPVTDDGLMRISPTTVRYPLASSRDVVRLTCAPNCQLSSLLSGEYDELIDAYCIIDCRFDYEFAGGHVEGAINLSTSAAIESFLLQSGPDSLFPAQEEMPHPTRSGEVCPSTGSKRKTILIFHCEFSAKRAPTLAGHLRCKDRTLNIQHYPAVHYPDVYVLNGGYAEYYRQYPDTCDPKGYTPMDHPSHLPTRSKGIAELRKNRMGARTHSYTYGVRSDTLRAQLDQEKGIAGPAQHAARPASSSFLPNSFGVSSRPTSSGNMSLFKGVIGSSKLTIQHEAQEDQEDEEGHEDEEEGGESSAEAENSFTATKHGFGPSSTTGAGFDSIAESSSPMAGSTGSPGFPSLGNNPLGGAGGANSKMLMMMGDSPLAGSGKPKPMPHIQLFQQKNLFGQNSKTTGGKAGQQGQGIMLKPGRNLQRAYTSTGMFG